MSSNLEQGMFVEERKSRIVEFINEHEKATVLQLCAKFEVSKATIRNDLNELDEKGLIKRTHGGAISTHSVNYEMSIVNRGVWLQSEKEAIAKQALSYIRDGDCIGMDAGTTTFELVKLLSGFSRLTIVTYDLNIAAYLDANTENTVILAGNGVDAQKGLTTPNLDTARLKKCMIMNARHKVLLADHSKINNVSFSKYADLSEIDVFITDAGADKKSLRAIEDKDVEVVVVK